MWALPFLSLSLTVLITSSNAVTIDVEAKYHAVTYDTIKRAIREAQDIFKSSPNTVVTIKLGAGSHYLKPPSHKQTAINFSGQQPGPHGRLILEGKCVYFKNKPQKGPFRKVVVKIFPYFQDDGVILLATADCWRTLCNIPEQPFLKNTSWLLVLLLLMPFYKTINCTLKILFNII